VLAAVVQFVVRELKHDLFVELSEFIMPAIMDDAPDSGGGRHSEYASEDSDDELLVDALSDDDYDSDDAVLY
jgi:hypothetical protein